jgi:hypothetical protein
MSKEIVPMSDSYEPNISKQARRQLDGLGESTGIGRAVVAGRESVAHYQAQLRIENGYALAEHTVMRSTQLDRQITQNTRDNPGLEVGLRGVRENVDYAATQIIMRYMLRP